MKWVPFFLFLVMCIGFAMGVVPTTGIQAVRNRTESSSSPLSDADKAEIDKFILSALNDIFLSKTSEATAQTRRQILTEKGTKDLSMYATTYIMILREHLRTSAYTSVQRIEDPVLRLMVRRNLMILVAELRSLMLIEFALDRVEDPDAVIRYWAVKSLTNRSIAAQLNSEVTANPEAAAQIFEKLQVVIRNEKQPEILVLAARFAAAWNDARGAELLQQMAARRMEDYRNCQVRHEWLDGRILGALGDKYVNQKLPEEKSKTARAFAELLAIVMQRYIQEQGKPQDQKTLSEEAIFQLVSVMVEAEELVFPKLDVSAVGIKRTLERVEDMQPVFDELFGTETRRGVLRTRLGFEYSRDAGGAGTAAPPKLPPCPPAGG